MFMIVLSSGHRVVGQSGVLSILQKERKTEEIAIFNDKKAI